MGLNIKDLSISSPAFAFGKRTPDRFANDKGNDQPDLCIHGVPAGTVGLAIICHDPDAPLRFGFTHWLLYGIPADTGVIKENSAAPLRPGDNDFGQPGYGGPQPPQGHGPRHYYFWVYALDTKIEGTPSRNAFLERYREHILEQNRLVGIYQN